MTLEFDSGGPRIKDFCKQGKKCHLNDPEAYQEEKMDGFPNDENPLNSLFQHSCVTQQW